MDLSATDTICTITSLIASVASLALAVVAIWIALYGKREAERTNQKTQDLLTEIRSDAKSIAQYAIPELKAYGDSVRRYVFQKGDEDSITTSVLSKIENVMTENIDRIRGEIDNIRGSKDLSAVRRKLADLEQQLMLSQETVRKSVEDSERFLHVSRFGEIRWSLSISSWVDFLGHLEGHYNYRLTDYGTKWAFVNPITGLQLAEEPVKNQRPFSELGLGSIQKLDLVELS